MTDVFACARAQIYYNSKWKPLAQVKRESGCSHIINGYLFNGSFQPVGWTVIDGKVISRDAYQDWGISIGSDGKPQMLTDRGGSFLSGVPLLKNGAKLERSLTPDVARSAARTAVGWMPDGRICLWCDKTNLTRDSSSPASQGKRCSSTWTRAASLPHPARPAPSGATRFLPRCWRWA